MNRTRLSGIVGIVGGLSYAIAGCRMVMFGVGEDRMTDGFAIVWAACWIVAGFELLRIRVTGPGWLGRIVSIIPVLGFLAAMLLGVQRLFDTDADQGPFAVAPIIVIAGMLATGIMTIVAGVWKGWRRFIPLLIALVYIGSVWISGTTGMPTLSYGFILAGIGYVLLGDSIRVHKKQTQVS